MNDVLSPNTKAILLLTAPLIAGRVKKSIDPLTPGEYKKLAQHLRGLEAQPGDLLVPDAAAILQDCRRVIDETRLERLLARGFLLTQAVEHWQARAIWVVSRADDSYPQRLKKRLRENAPALLYGCGSREIVDTGGLAVVGSRNADEALTNYTEAIGQLTAQARQTLVSGGARGIDQAAMRGAVEEGGKVTGVLADSLERRAMNREDRNRLLEGQLVLISPYDPRAGFNVGHAMQRNKIIYALADAALVVNADLNKGGTWQGATEQLQKLHLVPVYVRSTGSASKGLEGLKQLGALPWPNPKDGDGLELALAAPTDPPETSLRQGQLPLDGQHEAPQPPGTTPMEIEHGTTTSNATQQSAGELFRIVERLVRRLVLSGTTPSEIAVALGISKRQTDKWLKRLVDSGALVKRQKPVRYENARTYLPESEDPPGLAHNDEQELPADELLKTAQALLRPDLIEPKTAAEIAGELGVIPSQAEQWLTRLVEQGVLEKVAKPTRFVRRPPDLFGGRSAADLKAIGQKREPTNSGGST